MAAEAKRKMWNRNFICILAANCMLQMSNSATNTLISTYATYLGAGAKLMGLLTGLFHIVAISMRPVAGPVQTRLDHRMLIKLVFGLGAVVNLGYALFHSIPMFVFFRFLHGVQYAFLGALCMTVAANSLPPDKIAAGLGFFGASSAIAQAIAPRIGIFLRAWGTQRYSEDVGYTLLFAFCVFVLLLAQIPCWLILPERRERKKAVSQEKWYRQIISPQAIAPSVIVTLLMISYSTYQSYMVPFGDERGLANVGVFFTVLAVTMLAVRPFSGWLSDRLGLRNLLIPGIGLFFVSFFVTARSQGMTGVVIGAVLAAIGYGTASPTAQALVVQTEPRERRSVASNTLYIGMDLGLFLGPLIGGFIKDFAGDFKTVILCGSAACVAALVVFLLTWTRCRDRIALLRAKEEAEEAAAAAEAEAAATEAE